MPWPFPNLEVEMSYWSNTSTLMVGKIRLRQVDHIKMLVHQTMAKQPSRLHERFSTREDVPLASSSLTSYLLRLYQADEMALNKLLCRRSRFR